MSRQNHGGGPLDSSKKLLETFALVERDYLALGGDLQGFYERAERVSRRASSLMMLGAGEQLEALTRGMNELLARTSDSAESLQGVRATTAILDKAGRIESRLGPFRNVVRSLQILRTSISIESSRFGAKENVFGSLSEDVGNLAQRIHEKSALIMEQSRRLIALVGESLDGILKLDQARREKGERMAESVRSNGQALSDRHRFSSDELRRIDNTWQEITASIGEIVSSLQFHDITRQRIEHVDDALKNGAGAGHRAEAAPQNQSGRGSSGIGKILRFIRPSPRDDSGAGLRENYLLQRAQLVHTREELAFAIRTITQGLGDISTRIDGMSHEAARMARDAEGSGGSFYTGMEEALVDLTGAVQEHAVIQGEMAGAVERVANAVSGMDGYLREIVKIGIEMKMIALNAAIHAAHVGEEGLALGVLAEHLHRLAMESSVGIEAIGEDLNAIFIEADLLKRCAAGFGAGGAEDRVGTTGELRRMISVLKDLNEKSMSMLESIEEEGKTLSAEVQDRAGGLPFEGILQAIDTLVAAIDREVEGRHADPSTKGGKGEQQGSGLTRMAGVYTMEREREVHRAVLGMGDPPAEAAPQSPCLPGPGGEPAGGKKSGDDLGDNVELF